MFSFFRKYAASINGIEVYPKVAMVIFLVVFFGMIWIALKANKKYIEEIEQLPLD
jgi:cytochrome c oxidase cbb3-type subunit IV